MSIDKQELEEKVIWLIADEAREIAIELKLISGKNHFNFPQKHHTIASKKREILTFFKQNNTPYNSELVKQIALDYLDEQIRLSGVFNKSYEILRNKIQKREYDFDFAEAD